MAGRARSVEGVYLTLTLCTTLAASFIWGVNTLFLLDAGLSVAEAFGANACYTLGMVLFEIPTGVVADTRGRRFSFLLGAGSLLVSTLMYVGLWAVRAPFWAWAVVSALIGLGYTFFSGATEAWLVDALRVTEDAPGLERVFGHAQVVGGVAMLAGSALGGLIAQVTNLGVPYLVRAGLLGVTLAIAWLLMRDEGFVPASGVRPLDAVRTVLDGAVRGGLRNPPVKWLMLAAPFTGGVGVYVFYALQPVLLGLYGDPHAYFIAGLAAALVAGAQIVGGLLVPVARRVFRRRSDAFILMTALAALAVAAVGLGPTFPVALLLVALWSVADAITTPLRQSFINGLIPSEQRATVLSFDSLMDSAGGAVVQPTMGGIADAAGYGPSLVASAVIQSIALPFMVLARRQRAASDPLDV